LSDPGKDVAKSYGVVTPERELPHRWTYYIDPEGKILHIDKSVDTNDAGADIAARLKELGVAASSE
jgi:peroxiredoxin